MPAIVETSAGAPGLLEVLRHDRDRYLLSLFVPAARRPAVQAIYAFNCEIARVRDRVREPLLGQIRLQWWREGIEAAFAGETPRWHAVLTPLAAAIRDCGLSRDHFERLLAARERDLSPDPPATLAGLEAYAEETSAPLQLLVLEILGAAGGAATLAAREAAIAYALAGLLRATPFLARSTQRMVPPPLKDDPGGVVARAEAHLVAARAVRRQVPRAAVPAVLPAVLAAADLARLRRARFDPFAPTAARGDPWRAWRLAAAAWSGRY